MPRRSWRPPNCRSPPTWKTAPPPIPAESRTVTLAAEIELAGCSVEDFTDDDGEPIYDIGLAAKRVTAAAEAARCPEAGCAGGLPRWPSSALVWIIARRVAPRWAGGQAGAAAWRDLWVGVAVAASWFAVWVLYSALLDE